MRHLPLALLCLIIGTTSFVGCTESKTPENVASPSVTPSAEGKIALISIISDPLVDAQEVNMGLTFAGFCVDEGYDVNIFLNVKGVKLATNKFSAEAAFKDHSPMKKQLMKLKERGVQIHVCPVCMKDFEIKNSDIIPEAFVTDKPKLFSKLGSDTMVFTY